MKSTLELLLVALIIGAVLTAPVAAATSQGLEWGVANADRFSYQLTVTSESSEINEGMYIDVESAPDPIPNIVTAWSQIPELDLGAFWDNGTSLGLFALMFIFIGLTGGKTGVPIGNFTLLSELVLDVLTENVTATSSYYYWTTKYTGTISGDTITVTTSYLKSDGFLAKYILEMRNETHTQSTLSLIQDGLPSDIVDMLMSNILIIGIGVVVLIIIGAVVCKKR